MRRTLFALILAILVGCCAASAADEVYTLTACSGSISVSQDNYIVLTPSNLADHPDFLASIGKTSEDLLADWAARGVQLQAWTKKMDACLEVTVLQDEESRQYFDLERQTRQVRNEYLNAHKSPSRFSAAGWTITKLEWKKQKLGGNFLKFEYRYTEGETSRRGIARKTVRNGYTVMLDYQVYATYPQERLPRGSDENYLNKIANTVTFENVEPASLDAGAAGDDAGVVQPSFAVTGTGLLQVTVPPPKETNTDTFTIEGTATPGAHIIGVAMRYSPSTALQFTTDARNSGTFSLKITLPEEGLWHLTLNLEQNNQIIAEENFDTTTYSKTSIPVTMDAEVPETLPGDELVLSGVTSRGVTVQCIVSNGSGKPFDKTVTTNGTGKFRFKVPSAAEGEYDIMLAFSKKNFTTRRLTWTARRSLSSQEVLRRDTAKAIHPAYKALSQKLDTYVGQTMVYTAWIVSVTPNGDEYMIEAALKSDKKKGYSDLLYFIAPENPGLETDAKVKIYGVCTGAYLVQSEEGDTAYPGFDYLYSE